MIYLCSIKYSMTVVNLKLELVGHYYNHWPRFQITHDGATVWDGSVQGCQTIDINLTCSDKSHLLLRHLDKKFGEQGIWDTAADGSQDRFIEIKDIKFDDVSVGSEFLSSLVFCSEWSDQQLALQEQDFLNKWSRFPSNGMMSFNGCIEIDFEVPVYTWLIPKKYKVPRTDAAYFSNYSLRWHYEKDLELIEEIKELMNFDQDTDTQRS